MTNVAPVTYEDFEPTRYSTNPFNSVFFIILLSGVRFAYFFMNSVSWSNSTPPGATQFTRISGARCVDRNFVMLITPAFETLYPTCLCPPSYRSGLADTIPVDAEKLTIEPFLLFLAYSLQTENSATRFTSINFENDSRVTSKRVTLFWFFST